MFIGHFSSGGKLPTRLLELGGSPPQPPKYSTPERGGVVWKIRPADSEKSPPLRGGVFQIFAFDSPPDISKLPPAPGGSDLVAKIRVQNHQKFRRAFGAVFVLLMKKILVACIQMQTEGHSDLEFL